MERYASLTNYTRSEIDIEALIKNCYLCKLHRTFFDCSLLRLLAAIFLYFSVVSIKFKRY